MSEFSSTSTPVYNSVNVIIVTQLWIQLVYSTISISFYKSLSSIQSAITLSLVNLILFETALMSDPNKGRVVFFGHWYQISVGSGYTTSYPSFEVLNTRVAGYGV